MFWSQMMPQDGQNKRQPGGCLREDLGNARLWVLGSAGLAATRASGAEAAIRLLLEVSELVAELLDAAAQVVDALL
ncbi:MAG: hypothetical protein ACOVLH_00440, partial [Roseateles sp.]